MGLDLPHLAGIFQAPLLGPPRWGWPGLTRRLTQGCGRLASLAVLHPGLA